MLGNLVPDYDVSKVFGVCLVTHTCRPVVKDKNLKSFTATTMCRAENGVCEPLLDCAKRNHDGVKTFGARVLPVAREEVSKVNKFKDTCWETNGIKDRRGTIQILDGSDSVIEEACNVTYACKGQAQPKAAVCEIKKEVVGTGDKQSSTMVCPQLNDCINGDLSLPGHTEKELESMSAEQRERVMRQYEKGVDKFFSTQAASPASPRQNSTSPSTNPVHTPK